MSGEDKPANGQNAASYVFTADYGQPGSGLAGNRFPLASRADAHPPRLDRAGRGVHQRSGFRLHHGPDGPRLPDLPRGVRARLGSWLPNPRFLYQSRFEQDNPAWPHGLPNFRGISYLAREVFGLHSGRGRLVQVTDGGTMRTWDWWRRCGDAARRSSLSTPVATPRRV